MKTTIIAVLLLLMAPSMSFSSSIKVGDEVALGEHREITLLNGPFEQWVSIDEHRIVDIGDKCIALKSGILEVKAINGNDIIVSYISPGQAVYNYCPNGACFKISRADYMRYKVARGKMRSWKPSRGEIVRTSRTQYPVLKDYSIEGQH